MPLTRVVQPLLLTDRVFDQIHAAIMNGELQAGTPLRVRDLAEQVGTSVMPVREAIRRLEESGLAVREPHKGAVVKALSTVELAEAYDLRILLECEAARRGAAATTSSDHKLMRRIHADLIRAVAEDRLIEAIELDEALLAVLYAAAGNSALVESIRNMWQRCRPFKVQRVRPAGHSDGYDAWSHLPLLISAAEHADGATASDITRESLISAQRQIEIYLRSLVP
jgi:DNA-binding GntR family transcriptional regulator